MQVELFETTSRNIVQIIEENQNTNQGIVNTNQGIANMTQERITSTQETIINNQEINGTKTHVDHADLQIENYLKYAKKTTNMQATVF